MRRLIFASVILALALTPYGWTLAQSEPRLVQTEDGTLWVLTSSERYRIVPQQIDSDALEDIPQSSASEIGLILDTARTAALPRERADGGHVTTESTAERMRVCIPGSRVEGSGDQVAVIAPGPPEEQASLWKLVNLAPLEGLEWQAHPRAIDIFISFTRMPISGEDSETTTARRVVRNAMLACFPGL
jgi:hypothetical protein